MANFAAIEIGEKTKSNLTDALNPRYRKLGSGLRCLFFLAKPQKATIPPKGTITAINNRIMAS
jgi:hypothetical protein